MTSATHGEPVYFGSDNQTGAHPAIIDAISRAGAGFAPSYGGDDITRRVEARINEVFERDCEVFLVATGTAANALILSALSPPWGSVYCHEGAHIDNDENTAPEFFGGSRLIGIPGEGAIPDPTEMEERITAAQIHGVHNVKPSAISLTNATEAGVVLNPDRVAVYGELARRHGLALHVDGARFSNAVAATGASPADLTWRAGVDALSFGATKNGALAAEAIVLFNDRYSEDFAYRRKRAGHLWSKHQFLAAQFDAFLEHDLWLNNARHANRMAQILAEGLAALPGVSLPWSTDANEVFPVLPPGLADALEAAGFIFLVWPIQPGMVRFVTSYATREKDIHRLLDCAREFLKTA